MDKPHKSMPWVYFRPVVSRSFPLFKTEASLQSVNPIARDRCCFARSVSRLQTHRLTGGVAANAEV